jgi:autotransporter-associated beta strand protein
MAVRYFDLNGVTSGFGTMTGAWDTSSAFWSTAAAGTVTPTAFTFTNADTAQFGATGVSATGGTATIAAALNITLNSIITQNVSGSQIIAGASGATLTLAGTAPVINAGTALSISAVIAGSTDWSKTGTAQLTLSGANTFSGNFTISAGNVLTQNASALGSNTAGRTISIQGASTTLTINSNTTSTLTNVAMALDAGTLTLSGGVGLNIVGLSTTGSTGGTVSSTSNGQTLTVGASRVVIGTTAPLTLRASGGTTATLAGALSGAAGSLLIVGAATHTGTFTLNTSSFSFLSAVQVKFGTLSLTNSGALAGAPSITVDSGATLSIGAATSATTTALTISGNGSTTGNGAVVMASTVAATYQSITVGAPGTFVRAFASGTLAGPIALGSNDFAAGASSGVTFTLSGAITGTGGFTAGAFSGNTGIVTLSSATTNYSGNTGVVFGSLLVTGVLGLGNYAGDIGVASGATFNYNGSTNQTLSGLLSGAGTFRRGPSTPSSVLTITNANTFGTAFAIDGGIVSVATIGNGGANSPLGTNSVINIGTSTFTGVLRYTGAGETTDKVITFASTSTGGATLDNSGSGPLTFTSALAGASSASTRTLSLTGSAPGYFTGVIANVGGGAGATAIGKSGPGYWSLDGANTFTGAVAVAGGQLNVPALTALGSGTKTITVNTSSFRNASILLNVASATYASGLSWAIAGHGVDQTNSPLGSIRALVDSTISGTVTLTATANVHADTGNLTINGLISSGGSTSFYTRAASGRTVSITAGISSNLSLTTVGPGTTVWAGNAANGSTSAPAINGGTLRLTMTASSGLFSASMTSVNFGLAASQTGVLTSRYQYTGGTLELSNSGASGPINYAGLSSTSALNVTRGSAKLRLLRDAAFPFTVTLGTNAGPTNGVITLEYGGTAGAGTIGTDSSIIFNGASANGVIGRVIISDGSSLVPVYLNASKVAIPAVYDGTQTNVRASQAGGATLTATTTASNHNLTGAITAQVSTAAGSIRFDPTLTATPITLAAGAVLQSAFIMDMGTGTARTIVAAPSGGKLSRITSTSSTLTVYTNNVTGTGATISADVDSLFNQSFTKAGLGLLTFAGKVENIAAFQLSEGSASVASTGTYTAPYAGIGFANDPAAFSSFTFNQPSDVYASHVSGGGANTTLLLDGGDLVLGQNFAAVFGGNIAIGAAQKLRVEARNGNPENVSLTQAFQGILSVASIEMKRGVISIDPQYGGTLATGTPVTATGGSAVLIQAQTPLQADYTVDFGALTAVAGNLRVTLANSTASTNPFATRISATSITLGADAVMHLLAQTANAQQTFTITGAAAGPLGNGVNVYTASNIAYYRTAGQTLSGGGTASVGTVDSPIYGTDTNFSAAKTTGASFTSAGVNDNVTVGSLAIASQNTVTVKSLRTSVNITMGGGQQLTTDLVMFGSGATIAAGAIATQTGNLYVNTQGGTGVISSAIVNGAVPTRLILYTNNPLTLSGTNTHSGGTVVSGGSATITLSNALALGSGEVVGNGGAGFTIPASTAFSWNNDITLNDGGLVINAPTNNFGYALNGNISGAGPLFLTGNGTHALNTANTATGTLTLAGAGTVTLNANQSFSEYDFVGANHILAYGAGITQDISAFVSKRPSNTIRISIGSGNTVTWASSFGNGSTYAKAGDGTHVLAAENWLGAANIGNTNGGPACGVVRITHGDALGYGTVTLLSGNPGSTGTGATLELAGGITVPNNFTTSGEGIGSAGLIRNISGSNTLAGIITTAGGVSTVSRYYANAGSTLTFSGTITANTTLRTAAFGGAGTTVVTGVISDGSVTNTLAIARGSGAGAGTTRLLSANTYSRGTTITEGTVLAENENALGTGAVTLGGAGTLQTGTAGGQNGKLTVRSLNNAAGGTIRIGS